MSQMTSMDAAQTFPTLAPSKPVRLPDVETHGRSDVGRSRKINEDIFLIADLANYIHVHHTNMPRSEGRGPARFMPLGRVLLVADGMGGHGGGDVASAVATDTLVGELASLSARIHASSEEMIRTTLTEVVRKCQRRLHSTARRKGLAPKLGTTLTVALVCPPKLIVAHIGDSRCYVYRGGRLNQLTNDHTIGAELRREGHETAPQLDHRLTNALSGDRTEVWVETHVLEIESGDQVLLCSDGLTNEVEESEIETLLASRQPIESTTQRLISKACDHGGNDNVTVALARWPRD